MRYWKPVTVRIAAAVLTLAVFFPVLSLTSSQKPLPAEIPEYEPAVQADAGYTPAVAESAAAESESFPSAYVPESGLSPRQTLEAYFETQYLAYANLRYIDISAIVYTSYSRMQNSLVWLELLIQRRRLLHETGLCYVDTRMLPYEIVYLDESDISDNRLEFWRDNNIISEGEVTLHFEIKGTPGEAYPPMLAVNSQQTVRILREDGVWKISFHYYPGSVRKFRWLDPLDKPTDPEALEALIEEFKAFPEENIPDPPAAASVYDGAIAAEYARLRAEEPNPDFYHIGDWMGNCANFTSQCIWYGFGDGTQPPHSGDNMTNQWFAGSGGGSPAWENVDNFWAYAASETAFSALELPGATALKAGDLVQTRAKDMADDGFSHSLIVADTDTLLLAQNSPGNLVYYSDLVNVEARFMRPLWIQD